MKKTDLYIRVSTDEQAEKGYSQRSQSEALKKYCDNNSIEVRKIIFEDHSAKTFLRPNWQKLLSVLRRKRGTTDYILFTKWDRFSRNAGDAYQMISILRSLGVEPQAIEQPLDLTEGISFRYSTYNMLLPSFMKARANVKMLELRIALENQIQGTYEGIQSASLAQNQFSLSFNSHVQTRAAFLAGQSYATCDFHFDYDYLVSMAADFPELSEFLEQVEQGRPTHLYNKSFICNNVMLEAIHYIRKNPFSARSQKHIFVDCAKEILLAALEIIAGDLPDKPVLLTSRLIEALRHGKSFIERNVEEDISLGDLCRETGLSEYLLKKGFKTLFGVSPIGYQIQLKMEKAKEYLLQTDMDIAEIAYTLRYHYPQNFSLEFKRRFGCKPSDFRKYGRVK